MIKNSLMKISNNVPFHFAQNIKVGATNLNLNGRKLTLLSNDKVCFRESFTPVDPAEKNSIEIYKQIKPTQVRVSAIQKKEYPGGITKEETMHNGSGCILEGGFILTNAHVIFDDLISKVTLSDGRTFNTKFIGKDILNDVGLLKIEADDSVLASLTHIKASNSTIVPGQRIFAYGYPLHLDGILTQGILGSPQINNDLWEVGSKIPLGITVNPGNSGGAIVDSKGEVIGIAQSKMGGKYVEGIALAIPIQVALSIVEEIKQVGTIERQKIGIENALYMHEIPPIAKANLGLEGINSGIMLQELTEAGILNQAGFKTGIMLRGKTSGNEINLGGDIITKLNDRELNNPSDLIKCYDSTRKGKPIKVEYISLKKNYPSNKPFFIAEPPKTTWIET